MADGWAGCLGAEAFQRAGIGRRHRGAAARWRPAGSLAAGALLLQGGLTQARGSSPEPPDTSKRAPVSYWERAQPGAFVAGSLDGGAQLQSSVAAGYGRPHWAWLGIEASSSVSLGFASQSLGLTAAAPFGSVGLTARRVVPYRRPLLEPVEHVDPEDLVLGDSPRSRYQTAGLWLWVFLPLGATVTLLYASAARVYGVPADAYFFDERRTIAGAPPWVGSELLGELGCLDTGCDHRLGGVVEHVWSSRRGGDVWRAGPAYSASLAPHFSILAFGTWPFSSPDSLGWWASGGTATLSYAWSSTDPGSGNR